VIVETSCELSQVIDRYVLRSLEKRGGVAPLSMDKPATPNREAETRLQNGLGCGERGPIMLA
jgi:hypothetical protein